ncbi:MAG: CopG family ribbon-helix-helix protein [archaeon]|nr:CopG family ribbon-helix-helix protein [archaeon]
MTIISISLNDENVQELDHIKEVYGLKSRSDAVRTALNSARSEIEDLDKMEGFVEGILITVRHDHADPWMSLIQAKHVNSIKTQLHSHLKDNNCLEVMIISCDADDIRAMIREIQATGKTDYVRFVRS